MLQFLNRDEYLTKDRNVVMEEFQQIVNTYEVEIKNMNLEQCKEEEKRLMDIMNKHDEVMRTVEYDLPKSCTFTGSSREITRKTIGEYINEFLEKVECEYQYTLGYYELYMWWKDPQSKITYNNLNSTLQVLGNNNMRFRGHHQWRMILSINEYFKPLHNAYIIDNMLTHLYGACHSKLLDKMKIDNPLESEANEVPVPTEQIAEAPTEQSADVPQAER